MRLILLIVVTLISACQGLTGEPISPGPNATNPDAGTSVAPTGTDGAPEPGATPEPTLLPGQPDMSWVFQIPTDPASVDVALEADNTVTATVPITGGTLSVTGADGTVYTLEIPPNALFAPTTIGMTPASSVAGMPFGGEQTHAVQFSPEGQFFHNDAILTITPTEPIPVEEQLVFGYEAEGDDLILAAPVVESSEIKILVNHFSGNGVTKGLLADLEPARERVGGSAERRIENAMNAELARQRQRALAGSGQQDLAEAAANRAALQAILDQYEQEVVKPRVDAAGESCAAGQVAVQSVLRLARMRALMGLDGGEGGDPLAKYPGLLEKAAQVCVVEEFELCVEEHIIHRMVPVWLGFERTFALYGKSDAAVLREARDLTVACLTFDLEFESTGRLKVAAGGYESTVSSTIKLRFNPEDFTISGVAPLDNEEFDYTMPRCDVTSVPGGGDFEVFKLIPLDVPDAGYGSVRDLILTYVPGSTSESVSWVCDFPGGGTLKGSLPAFPAWTGTFIGTHQDELNTDTSPPPAGDITYLSEMPPGGGYTATDWEILAGEHFATKEWSESAGQFEEEGSFELYHRPSR